MSKDGLSQDCVLLAFRSSILHLPHFAAVHWPKREKRGGDWPTRAGVGVRSPQARKKNPLLKKWTFN